MKGIILLNGEPFEGDIAADGAFVICCDGAYGWANGRVRIDMNLGDYDSLPYIPTPPPEKIYPTEKDFTDGELALEKLIEMGADSIEIYGGGGKREDHFIGNLHLLYRARSANVKASLITNYAEIFAGGGRIELNGIKGKTFSVLPFGGTLHIIDSAGFKYAEPPEITYGECVGISNIAVSDSAYLEVADGDCALIFVNRSNI